MSEKKLTITGPHKMPEGHFIIRAIIHEAGERDSVEAMEFDDFESADAKCRNSFALGRTRAIASRRERCPPGLRVW